MKNKNQLIMKIYVLLLAFLFTSVTSLIAVPAVPWPVEKEQPDGTIITVYLKGDEKVSWMESADGYTLMYDEQKYVVYAQTDGQGNLKPSNIRFGSDTKPDNNIEKGLRYSNEQINTLLQIWEMTEEATVQRASTGNVNILCIMAAFSNRAFVRTQAEFNNLMNQAGYSAGGARGSVRDYFLECSYGLLNLNVTVIGTVTLPNTTVYYGNRNRWNEFANAVVNLADPLVDFSQFATNGIVEGFHIIFAGFGDEAIDNGQQIWSHKSTLGGIVTKDGVKLSNYSCSPELRGNAGTNITNIGVIAHELGHIFGSPDYYDTNGATDGHFLGAGRWCLMAGGVWNDNQRQPAHVNPYQKIKFGWITPQTIAAGSTITNMPSSATNPVVYKMTANSNGEHYLLENRQQLGFDTSLPGQGLLIWHIASSVSSKPNDKHPQQVYPVCASSNTAIPTNDPNSYGNINTAGCPFPGTSGRTEFTGTTTPRAFTWAGLASLGNLVTNIVVHTNRTVSFGPPVITGSSSVCPGSTATFTILNPLPGHTIKWVEGNWLQIQGANNQTSVTVKNVLTLNPHLCSPEGLIKAEFRNSAGQLIRTVQKNLTVNKIHVYSLNAPSSVVAGSVHNLSVSHNGGNVFFPNWQFSGPGNVNYNILNNTTVQAQFINQGNYTVTVSGSNVCGSTSVNKSVSVTSGGGGDPFCSFCGGIGCKRCIPPIILYSITYPNPVSDVLYIEIDKEAVYENRGTEQEFMFDIRLYDGLGNLLRQQHTRGETVELNVSNLSVGIYYLHVYDGINEKPETKQIVIER